jgi:hypothetical protein
VEDLDLFLLPNGQPGRRLTGAEEDTAMVATLVFFAATRAAAPTLLHHDANIQIDNSGIGYGDL